MKERMKNIALYAMLLLGHTSLAQTGPGGVGNENSNEIWLSASDNSYTDAGTTVGSNGESIQQWNDISGNLNHATQTNNSYKPSLNTNALNGFSTLTFNGSTDRMLATGITTSSQATIFAVVQFNNLTNNNDGIIQASPAGTAFSSTASNKSIGMWVNTSNGNIWGRGVQANNSRIDIPETTSLSTGQFYIITQDYNGTNITQYVDGAVAGSASYNGTLKDWSDFGIGRQANESLDGDLAEVIAHNESLNEAQRIITENYLAAKYGLTLTTNDVYNQDNGTNGNFDYDVAGIGRVDASNIHSDGQGRGIVRILNPTGLEDDEFLLWGHNNGVQEATNSVDVPVGVEARFDRVWRVSERNTTNTASVDVGNIDMRWDLNDLGNVTASDLRLLIDTDNDGLFGDETPLSGAVHLGDGIYTFQNVPGGAAGISDNSRFTLGTINVRATPLPIELIYFNAIAEDNKRVRLEWQTASEINNEFFTIERSKNALDWEIVKTVEGAGNSSVRLSYTTKDHNPHSGRSYYRLKQTDFDGQFEYSHINTVNIKESLTKSVEVYPNPTDSKITVKGGASELSEVRIVNLLGQDVTHLTTIDKTNETRVSIDLSALAKGSYYVITKSMVHGISKR